MNAHHSDDNKLSIKQEGNYGKRAMIGIAWMFTSHVGLNLMTLLVTMVLARFLTPADFGAIVLVSGITGILQTFAEMGMSVALIQRKEINQKIIDSAFMATLVTTCCVATMLWFVSSPVSKFFGIPVISILLKIATIEYFFRGIYALYRCLLLRDLKYKADSVINFGGYIIYGTSATLLAANNYGPFSVVVAQCIWSFCLILAGFGYTRYIPRSFGSIIEAWRLMKFGFWVSAGRMLRNGAGQIDIFVVGKVLSAGVLGHYYMAQKIILTIPMAYTRIIDQVTLPIYSKWQDDLRRVESGYWQALFYSAALLIPIVVLIFIFTTQIVTILFGSQWLEIVPLIRIMSLFGLAKCLGDGLFDSVVIALGRPEIVTIMNIFRFIGLPASILLGSLWGIQGVAWGFACYGVMGRIFGQVLLKIKFNFSLWKYVQEIIMPCFSAMLASFLCIALMFFISKHNVFSENLFTIPAIFIWIIIYVFFICLLAKKKCLYLLDIIFKARKATDAPVA